MASDRRSHAVIPRARLDGRLVEPGTFIALAASALFIGVLVVGVTSGAIGYRGGELNPLFAAVLALWACGLGCQVFGRRPLGEGLKTTAIFFLMTMTAALSSVVLARTGASYADSLFAAADRALLPGFDWPSSISAFDRHTLLTRALSYAYPTLYWQPELLLLYFCVARRSAQAWRVLSALAIALVVCIAIFPFCPALGGYVHFGIDSARVPNVRDISAWRYPEVLAGVRAGRIDALGVHTLEGIVAMPSYHASAAIILAWGFGASRLRWPFLLLNLLMLLSTVPIGGHYLVDVLAGAANAGVAILLARAVHQRPFFA